GIGGARRDRTDDLKLAKLPLSQLSYGPITKPSSRQSCLNLNKFLKIPILRKEVIQPQVPLRLPCYDFTPSSGKTNSHGVTGGVYK
ncbi:unnamed protein product, partial [Scytosiphon promiscuus]